ncbi:MAG TPA: DNA repair protein RecN [Vicinamibacterales bacterium]|nr:DNA repair protein RecN [Acidobacteriota bacterium]HOC18958.1 DNA repair protein RecN [Vicinamibacterales bacterium]
MLRHLAIQNLAVIEAAAVDFEPGLNVLTGETGAGKSILVEALGLLLGARSSPDLVRTGADAASVQAVFDDPAGAELILGREVTVSGRSRAFLDGRLVPATSLREAASRLVDLHGQHEHQALLDPDTHLDLLDRFAEVTAARAEVADCFAELRQARDELSRARQLEEQRAARTEIVEFQLAELGRVAPRPGEDAELASLRTLLASAERVRRLSDESYALLYDRDDAALGSLGQVWKRLAELAALDARFLPHLEQKDAIKAQLEDLAALLRGYAASLDASPARLQEVEDRLAALERLKRKHGPTLDDVLERHRALRAELKALGSAGERAAEAEQRLAAATERYLRIAATLSDARRQAAGRFSRALERQLADLAMNDTRFEVRFADGHPGPERWTARGTDLAEFYASPNPGEELRPLARIASGGEISRVMLAIKNLASLDQPGKTLIFDEVDAGIGGRVADAVGRKLRKLGESYQVLCITHLPQIAACGHAHYRIEKRVYRGRTTTRVERLDRAGREEELARMIGGETVSAAAKANAREMLKTRSAPW